MALSGLIQILPKTRWKCWLSGSVCSPPLKGQLIAYSPSVPKHWCWWLGTGTPWLTDLLQDALFCCLHRPVQGMKCVMPDALHVYHKNHQFLGHCCLCLLFQPQSKEPIFTEVAIYLPVHGRYKGEWVAECTKSQCGYLGKSLFSLNMIRSYTMLPSVPREGLQ